MSELLQHWNLITRPFEATWDSRFFFNSTWHLEALDRLSYVMQEGGMNIGVLTGEIGCGKTITRAVLQDSFSAGSHRFVVVENSCSTFDELLGLLLRRLTPIETVLPGERMAKLEMVQSRLEQEAEAGRQLVLILDEAQELPIQALHELRFLTNLNGGGRSLITLILIGQPCLRTMLQTSAAIDQRIGLRYHLAPLPVQELSEYLIHRLHVAGHPNGQIFEETAVKRLHELTRGVPRSVNRLAKLAMEHGWAKGATQIHMQHVESVAQDLAEHQSFAALAA